MKKVAYCLGGHLRQYQGTGIKENLLDKYPGDVYLFTYDSPDWKVDKQYSQEDIDTFLKYYNPKDYRIYNAQKLIADSTAAGVQNLDKPLKSLYENFYCKFKSNELRQKSKKEYDVVFFLRPDLKFKNFDFNEFNSPDKLWIPFADNTVNENIIADVYAFSNPENMDTYTSFVHYLKYYYPGGGDYSPETALTRYLSAFNLKYKCSDSKFSVLRYGGFDQEVSQFSFNNKSKEEYEQILNKKLHLHHIFNVRKI